MSSCAAHVASDAALALGGGRFVSKPGAPDAPRLPWRGAVREWRAVDRATDDRMPQVKSVRVMGRSLEHWVILGIGVAGLVLFLAMALWIEPDPRGVGTHERLGLPPCKPMEWWNVPCPGCGVTTSLALLAHGHPWDSFTNQPFGFVMSVGLLAYGAWCVVGALRGRDLYETVQRLPLGRPVIVLTVVMVVSWAYKLALVRHWI